MKTTSSCLLLTVALLAAFSSGCTPQARKARLLAKADRDLAAGRLAAAEIECLNALRIDGRNAAAIGMLGVLYFDEGKLGKAVPCLIETRRLAPDNLDARLKLGLYFLAAADFAGARGEAIYVLNRRPQDVDAPLLLAEGSVLPKDIEASRQRLGSLPESARGGAAVLLGLGTLEFRLHHFAAAEALFRQALGLEPHSSAAWIALGGLDWARNDVAAADHDFAQAAASVTGASPQSLQYAQFKIQTGDMGGARRLLEETVQKHPEFLPAQVTLAELDEKEKKLPDSAALAAKVLAQDPSYPDALLLSGRVKLALGDTAGAVAGLEKAQKIYPRYPRIEYELAQACLAGGETERAAACLSRAVALDPDFVEANMLLAEVSVQRGDPATAIILMRKLLEKQPGFTEARFLLASANAAQHNWDDALADYGRLAAELPSDPRAPFFSGTIHRRQHRDEAARADFAAALQRDPDYFPALQESVNLDLSGKRFGAARERLEAEIRNHPALPGLYVLLGRVHLAQREWAPAEAALREAIRLKPDSTAAYFLLAEMDSTIGRDQDALASLRRVVAASPRDVGALMLTGVIAQRDKDDTAARAAYEKLLAVDPNFSPALNNLAYLDSQAPGRLDEALALAQRANKASPDDWRIADTLGWILHQKHQYSWALGLLQESAAATPDDPEVQFHLGMTNYMLGQEGPARGALQRALQLNPDFAESAEARQRLAILDLDRSGGQAGDLALLTKASAERPDDPVVLLRLAAIYERQGDPAKAIAAAKGAVRANPKSATAQIQLARLEAAQGDMTKALALAKAARDLAPDDPDVALVLGRLAYKAKDYRWAASLLQEAAAAHPDDATIASGWALALESLAQSGIAAYHHGDFAKARGILTDYAALGGQKGEATFYLGMAQYRLKETSSKETLQRALGLQLTADQAAEANRTLAAIK